MKTKIVPRILLSLLGLGLIFFGLGAVMLGFIGERDMAIITSVSRQGGERTDGRPGRYTYSIGYTFTTKDGREINGSTTRIGNSIYMKADGTSFRPVRYLKSVPIFNMLEEDTTLTWGQPIVVTAGIILIVAINQRRARYRGHRSQSR